MLLAMTRGDLELLWAPPIGAAIWCALGLLTRLLTSWGPISKAFPATSQPRGKMFTGVRMKAGWSQVRGTVYVSAQGIYIAPTLFTGPAFWPVFIPLREMREIREVSEFGTEYVQFDVGAPELGWFRIPRHLFEGFEHMLEPQPVAEPPGSEPGISSPPPANLSKSERLNELRMLQQRGVPQEMDAFSKWSHQVRTTIFNDGESRRWDFLSAKYKSHGLNDASVKAIMEQLIAQEIEDLEDYTKHPGRKPIPGEVWISLLLIGIYALRACTTLSHLHSPHPIATPTPSPRAETISNQMPLPMDRSPGQ